MSINEDISLFTADLGYRLFDLFNGNDNFYNLGSSEQFMIGAAAGFALEGKIPVCYSITPFLLYRPFEFIRNFMHYEGLPIKLVGGGRDRDYGNLGFTHWAEQDSEILSHFNIEVFKPESEKEVSDLFKEFIYNDKPSYLNLKK